MIRNLIDNHEDHGGGMFESFSDLALCTLTISLVLVSLLATNVTQRINVQMNENQFNKDALPARTYIGSTYSETDRELVHLLDAAKIDAWAADTEARSYVRSMNLSEEHSMQLHEFLMVLPAIDRGIDQEGRPTIEPLPEGWSPEVRVADQAYDWNYTAAAELTDALIVFQSAGRVQRTRIYIESYVDDQGMRHVVIGHAAYPLPEALEDGSLDWLGAFMSGTIDLVYMGEAVSSAANLTNRRMHFFEKNGYMYALEAYRSYLSRYRAGERLESYPLLEHEASWRAYVAEQVVNSEDPPEWFYSQFLVPLGFDRMVMDMPVRESL
jgi:hypothetical protein